MCLFRIRNNASLPVHVAEMDGSRIHQHRNDLPPGGICELRLRGDAVRTLRVVPSDGANRLGAGCEDLAGRGVGVPEVLHGGDVVLVPFDGRAAALIGAGVPIAGAAVTVRAVAVEGGEAVLDPLTVGPLPWSAGYDVDIHGGEVLGRHDPATGLFTVLGVNPLKAAWAPWAGRAADGAMA